MTDDEFRDLAEEAALMQEMEKSDPGWMLLRDRASRHLENRKKELTGGYALSFEDYKARCSFMDGMNFVLDIPQMVKGALDAEIADRAERED